MDYFSNSTHSEGETAACGGLMGARLALEMILVVAVASAGVLVAGGWWLVAGA